jgi:transposase
MGRRRTHSEEFKREAVRLIRERGVTTAQASRDLGFARPILGLGLAQEGLGDIRTLPANLNAPGARPQ